MKLRALSSLKIGASLSVGASLIGAALLSAPMAALATEPGTVYVTPFIGNEQYSSERSIPWTMQYGIGGEYQITEQLGAEIDYMHSMDGHTRYNGYDVDISRLSLDGIWSFGRFGFKNIYEPYAKVGVGHVDYNYRQGGTSNDQDTDIDAGVGMRFHLTDRLSTRLEAKAIYETQSYQTQGLYTVGFSYSFGGAKPAPKAAPLPLESAPAVVAAPTKCTDADNDGVCDNVDQCLNTAPGTRVGPAGCDCDYTLSTHFAFNSANLTDSDKAELDKLAEKLANPNLHFVAGKIDGYTDSVGKAAYNAQLSKRRADAVAQYLKSKGVDLGSRITTEGFGAADPVADNATEEGRAANRRVVIRRTDCDATH